MKKKIKLKSNLQPLYKVLKTDWMVTVGKVLKHKGKKRWHVRYFYAVTKREALKIAKRHKGFVQLYKTSHEFRKVWVNE